MMIITPEGTQVDDHPWDFWNLDAVYLKWPWNKIKFGHKGVYSI